MSHVRTSILLKLAGPLQIVVVLVFFIKGEEVRIGKLNKWKYPTAGMILKVYSFQILFFFFTLALFLEVQKLFFLVDLGIISKS